MAIKPERLLISYMVANKDKSEIVKAGFQPENMREHQEELRYLLNRRKMPGRLAFLSRFPDFRMVKGVDVDDISGLMQLCRDRKLKQDVSRVITRSASEIRNGENPVVVSNYIQQASREASSNYNSMTSVDAFENLKEFKRMYSLRRKQRNENGGVIGIPYGLPTMDKWTGGMQNGEMVTFVARTGIGKTFLMNYFTAEAIRAGYNVMYCTMEMTWDQIFSRVLTLLSHRIQVDKNDNVNINEIIPNMDVNLGNIPSKKLFRLIDKYKEHVKGKLIVPNFKESFSISASEHLVDQHAPNLVIFDYFGLSGGQNGKMDNWRDAAEASHTAKRIAMEYDIPYVLGAQFNRAGAENPKVENIALTDAISQDSDKIFVLTKRNGNSRLVIDCQKFRGGADGWNLTTSWNVNYGEIKELRSDDSGVQNIEEEEFIESVEANESSDNLTPTGD